jgi:hypothetical protein
MTRREACIAVMRAKFKALQGLGEHRREDGGGKISGEMITEEVGINVEA